MRSLTFYFSVGRVAHPDMPEQKAAGQPVWAPSAIAAKGGKFRTLPGIPGYVTVSHPSLITYLVAKPLAAYCA